MVSAHELWAEQQQEFMERNGSSRPGYGFHYKAISANIMEHMRATFGGFGKVALEPVAENVELLASDDPSVRYGRRTERLDKIVFCI